jgi:hypothetical protein
MRVTQLSLFVENRRGAVRAAVDVLAKAGVDVASLSLADTSEFGILRLVVRDPARARAALEAAGVVVNEAEVMALEVDDRAGGLAEALAAVDQAKLEIEYLYAFPTIRPSGRAVLLVRFADEAQAREALVAAGLVPLSAEQLFERR